MLHFNIHVKSRNTDTLKKHVNECCVMKKSIRSCWSVNLFIWIWSNLAIEILFRGHFSFGYNLSTRNSIIGVPREREYASSLETDRIFYFVAYSCQRSLYMRRQTYQPGHSGSCVSSELRTNLIWIAQSFAFMLENLTHDK